MSELTCEQVIALLGFYAENKLNPKLKSYIDKHLNTCKKCKKIYDETLNKNNVLNNSQRERALPNKQYEIFRNNLSAYIDNELDENENLKVKKLTITNPNARRDIEDMYKMQYYMHESFNKTRNNYKNDYAKLIIQQINNNEKYNIKPLNIIGTITVAIGIILLGSIVILHF